MKKSAQLPVKVIKHESLYRLTRLSVVMSQTSARPSLNLRLQRRLCARPPSETFHRLVLINQRATGRKCAGGDDDDEGEWVEVRKWRNSPRSEKTERAHLKAERFRPGMTGSSQGN